MYVEGSEKRKGKRGGGLRRRRGKRSEKGKRKEKGIRGRR